MRKYSDCNLNEFIFCMHIFIVDPIFICNFQYKFFVAMCAIKLLIIYLWLIYRKPIIFCNIYNFLQAGQFQVIETTAMTPSAMGVYPINTHGNPLLSFDISHSCQTLAFGDQGGKSYKVYCKVNIIIIHALSLYNICHKMIFNKLMQILAAIFLNVPSHIVTWMAFSNVLDLVEMALCLKCLKNYTVKYNTFTENKMK